MSNYSIEDYVVPVDYGSSIAGLIANYGYTLTNYTYTERGFKSNDTKNTGRAILKMVVIRFRVPTSREAPVLGILRENHLRSATLKELMALGSGNANPTLYRLDNVLSLNKVQNPFGADWAYPQLFNPRYLGVIWYLDSTVTDWHFAAVRI